MIFELGHVPFPDGYGEALLPLAECKAHLAIEADEDEFDTLIELFRDAALEFVEGYCSVKLGEVEGLTWSAQGLQSSLRDTVTLGVWPVTGITGIDWADNDGEPVEGDPADFRVTIKGVLRPAIGAAWPSSVGGDVVVTFDAGFPEGEAPKRLLHAARMFMAHLFANREAVDTTGKVAGEIPLGVRDLCARFKPVVI